LFLEQPGRWSEGGDKLKSSESRQLTFVFAANPRGGGDDHNADESAGRLFLLYQANVKETIDPDAGADDASCLLERVASVPNLARALLKVARNMGAAGVDGQRVGEVVEMSPDLLPRVRQALIDGTYLPGDIRRVWIPKSGGGERQGQRTLTRLIDRAYAGFSFNVTPYEFARAQCESSRLSLE
jgi:hypothetical protein